MVQIAGNDLSSGRILFLITTLTLGGAETQVARLAIELKAQGWTVAIACLVPPNAHVENLEKHGIQVHSLGMQRGIPDPRALLRFRTLVGSFKPDVVHSHMFHANLFGRLSRVICRFPALICTAHNLRETSERGGPTWHKELLYRSTDFLADRTTIICRAAYDRYLRVGAVPASKFQVVPNGVDTDHFAPSAEGRAAAKKSLAVNSRFVWLTIGRLVKQKDYPNMFRAFVQLQSDSLLLIAGSGPLEAELREECNRLGLSERVRFCGTSENILPLFHCADAFVLASEFEGLSGALIEASSMGLPAAVTDVGGNGEIVLNGVTGYCVPPQDPSRLAAAMQQLESLSEEQRQVFSTAARHHCWEHYRLQAITRQWAELYRHPFRRVAAQPQALAAAAAATQVNA